MSNPLNAPEWDAKESKIEQVPLGGVVYYAGGYHARTGTSFPYWTTVTVEEARERLSALSKPDPEGAIWDE